MRVRRRLVLAATVPVIVAAGILFGSGALASRPATARSAPPLNRYSLVHGCFLLHGSGLPSGPFRMQATSLGDYLLYGTGNSFMSAGGAMVRSPSADTVWRVEGDSRHGFTITNTGVGGTIPVRFGAASGCATYPEGQVDATGPTFAGPTPESTVTGTIDAHTHVTAFEFLGGDWHCGKPWDPFGIPHALPNCAPYEQGTNGQVESFVDYGAPAHQHDTQGWPTFRAWPSPTDLAEEGDYYTGIERAWKAGLRVMVTQLVDNEALCDLMSSRRNPCDDMASVRIQAGDLRALQNYIDAQAGGPGKGFFQVVTNPFQARAVINSGKLAVVEGIEVSDLFHCGEVLGTPKCNESDIDAGLREVRGLGVSTFFPVHKFDNAFGGAKMDSGEEGVLINGGNHLETGQFFDVKTCTGPEHDTTQMSSVPAGGGLASLLAVQDKLRPATSVKSHPNLSIGGLLGSSSGGSQGAAAGAVPVYPPPPHCNQRGLTPLGSYLIKKMVQEHLIVELDHMDAKTADATLSILEAHRYSGVVSAHSWDSPQENPRIYNLGGFVTPIAGASPPAFISQWKTSLKIRNKHFYGGTGFGYGADMNGLAEESQPTSGNPIHYPFKSYDGKVTFTREQWGQRTFDINKDGVANYGMFPDWLNELQTVAGRPILTDMFHGAEAYLQMWERVYGVPSTSCRPARARLGRGGLKQLYLGATSRTILYAAGQPVNRPGRAYTYCVSHGGSNAVVFGRSGRVSAVLSTAGGNTAGGWRPGSRVSARSLRGHARSLGHGVWIGHRLHGGSRYILVTRGGRVHAVGVVDGADARHRGSVRSDVAAATI